jgi:hypothetical protein
MIGTDYGTAGTCGCRLLERIGVKWHTVSFTFSTRITNLSMSRKTTAGVMGKPGAVVGLRIGVSVSMGRVDRAGGVGRRAFSRLGRGKNNRLDQAKADQDGENAEAQGLHFGLNSRLEMLAYPHEAHV